MWHSDMEQGHTDNEKTFESDNAGVCVLTLNLILSYSQPILSLL